MILYAIKSILCAGLFITAYYLFLEKENMHRFKRFYLLGTLLFSFVIPLITIELKGPVTLPSIVETEKYFSLENYVPDQSEVTTPLADQSELTSGFDWISVFLVAYGVIGACLLLRMLNNFLSIVSATLNKTVTPYREASLVLDEKHIVPYSFLNYIFITKADSDNKHILLHELTHIRQKHSLDILLVEFLHCILWFNPVIFFYKRAIRLNHEFLADEVVIKNYPTADYQNILFQKTQLTSSLSLTSSFNYSATKKRFVMMTRMKNETRASLRIMFAFIFSAGITILFIEKTYAQKDSTATQKDMTPGIQRSPLTDFEKFDSLMNRITRKRIDKNGAEKLTFNFTGVTDSVDASMLRIYESMTPEQKAKYPKVVPEIFKPIPSPKKKSPTADQMSAWANPKIYGVWLDGNRISNDELKKYKPSDIVDVFESVLLKNAAHYGQYKFQVILLTNEYFDKVYPPKSN